MSTHIRPYISNDFEEVDRIRREAFRGSMDDGVWQQGGWILEEDGRIGAVLLIERAGQCFGGSTIPSALVRSVAVASEARRKGWGSTLLAYVLAELREEGIPLSVLYPTGLSVYRRVGYEIAGSQTRYAQPLSTLPRDGVGPVERLDVSLMTEIRACYDRFALMHDGLLQRPESWWRRMESQIRDGKLTGCVTRTATEITGYMLYTQQVTPPATNSSQSLLSAYGLTFSLDCRDLIWTEGEAAHTLLAYAAGSSVLGTELHWTGPSPEPLALYGTTQGDMRILWAGHWMSRLLHVHDSLERRGYPAGHTATIEFDVVDVSIPTNAGALRLEIADGSAHVTPIRSARIKLDIGTLASIYTGWLRAGAAARMGRLPGATEREIEMMERTFGDSSPWCNDVF